MIVYFCSLNKRHGVFCIWCRLARVFLGYSCKDRVLVNEGWWRWPHPDTISHILMSPLRTRFLNTPVLDKNTPITTTYSASAVFRMTARMIGCISAVILKYIYMTISCSHSKVYPWQSQSYLSIYMTISVVTYVLSIIWFDEDL